MTEEGLRKGGREGEPARQGRGGGKYTMRYYNITYYNIT